MDVQTAADIERAKFKKEQLMGQLDSETGARQEDILTELYSQHYVSLVRLATLLLGRAATAPDAVQEAFIGVYLSRSRPRQPALIVGYLRRSVVNQCRSQQRRWRVASRFRPDGARSSTGQVEAILERDRVVRALQTLPRRQREVIVLRYYGDLTEAQTADTLGIGVGSVKSYTFHAMAALAVELGGSS